MKPTRSAASSKLKQLKTNAFARFISRHPDFLSCIVAMHTLYNLDTGIGIYLPLCSCIRAALSRSSKRPCVEQMAWCGQVIAILIYAGDFPCRATKVFCSNHSNARASVIFFSSDYSTVPQSPKLMNCNHDIGL